MAHRSELSDAPLQELLVLQDGVVARRQLLAVGARPHDLDRMMRRRELRRVHPGVYVAHTGELTRRQREWAAILSAWPAALAGESALPGSVTGRVEIAVGRGRAVRVPAWVDVRHVTHLRRRTGWNRSPPRIRIEHPLLDVLAARIRVDDIAGAFSRLADVLHTRRTTVPRVLEALQERERITGRRLIVAILTDARDGICSVLERGYRDRVERAHGLPTATRQRVSTATGARTLQDVYYRGCSLVVELDGLLFHNSAASRDADAGRDLAELAASGAPTARVTYGLVFTTPCRTAGWIAAILRTRGWQGTVLTCPRCPPRGADPLPV